MQFACKLRVEQGLRVYPSRGRVPPAALISILAAMQQNARRKRVQLNGFSCAVQLYLQVALQ